MGPFAWGVALVVAVCLLQLPAAYLLGSFVEREGPAIDDPTTTLPAAIDQYDREPGVCPRCGTQNGLDFAYCANCASPLRRLADSE